MSKEYYVGVMSGTSIDAVDVVLCEISPEACALLKSQEYPFPSELKSALLKVIQDRTSLEELGQLDHRLGLLFTEAIVALLRDDDIDTQSIRAIGLHGQTLWHQPEGQYPFTLQLGDPNIVAAGTGIAVVADFRRKDVALGGQGAPFAPAFHEFIFDNIKSSVAVVNIGGMANITVFGEKLIGYDTGCGNVLMDLWIAAHKDLSYDKEGAWARSGKVDYGLLDAMMSDDFFAQPYPKSTGREKFNIFWLEHKIKQVINNLQKMDVKQSNANMNPADVQRTLLELTALSISNEVLKFNRDLVLLCGGGAKNRFLVERLKVLMPNIEVAIAENADEIEAMTFAWLAYKRLHREPVNLKDVTGASENTILGGIYE